MDLEPPYHVNTIMWVLKGLLSVLVDKFSEGPEHLYPLLESDGGRSKWLVRQSRGRGKSDESGGRRGVAGN